MTLDEITVDVDGMCDWAEVAKIGDEMRREIGRLRSELGKAKARIVALEQVISEEMYPENCSDAANAMLLESAIDSHARRLKGSS